MLIEKGKLKEKNQVILSLFDEGFETSKIARIVKLKLSLTSSHLQWLSSRNPKTIFLIDVLGVVSTTSFYPYFP